MPNTYFRFKEFIIDQDKCSMKVCTDACIFGSLLPVSCREGHPINNVLDVGTGTGLLSLMYAQRNLNAVIDAVEIEENAFAQAKENFNGSKWKDRISLFHTDIKDLAPGKKYDLVISNPPFYENELASGEKKKDLAKHDDGLTLKDLIHEIKTHLSPGGCFAVLLPYHRIQYFEDLAAVNDFFLQQKILIRQTPSHNFFRGVLIFGNKQQDPVITELTIRDSNGNYTPEFIQLLKDYYLKL